MALPLACTERELLTAQEPPWPRVWFTATPRTHIPNDHGRISKANPPRGVRIHEKIRHGQTRLRKNRRRGLLGHELHRTNKGDHKQVLLSQACILVYRSSDSKIETMETEPKDVPAKRKSKLPVEENLNPRPGKRLNKEIPVPQPDFLTQAPHGWASPRH